MDAPPNRVGHCPDDLGAVYDDRHPHWAVCPKTDDTVPKRVSSSPGGEQPHVPVHANLVEREREWSRFKLHATFVLYPRRPRSGGEAGTLRIEGGEVVPQTGLDPRLVVTAAAAAHQHHRGECQSRRSHRALHPRQCVERHMSCVPDKAQDVAARCTVVVVRRMKIAAVAGVAVASAVISARTGTSALLMRREAYYRLAWASVLSLESQSGIKTTTL